MAPKRKSQRRNSEKIFELFARDELLSGGSTIESAFVWLVLLPRSARITLRRRRRRKGPPFLTMDGCEKSGPFSLWPLVAREAS